MPAVPQTRKRAHEGVTWLPGYLTRTRTGRGTGAAAGRALFRAGRRGRHRPERLLAHGAVIRGGSLSPLPQASPALCCRVVGRGARRPGPPCVRALAVTAAPQAGRRRRGSVQRGGARNRVWSPKHSFSACVSPAASAAKAPGRGGLSPQWQAGLPARRRWSAGAGSQPLGAHGIAGLARPRRPACAVWCSSPAGGAGAGTRRALAARRGRARAPATGRPRAPTGPSPGRRLPRSVSAKSARCSGRRADVRTRLCWGVPTPALSGVIPIVQMAIGELESAGALPRRLRSAGPLLRSLPAPSDPSR